ncbi:hypothetical protein VOLCADRAFT_96774 [Volvox carteri f. nagariensis]|uniref:Uncharacterized protein n=1 Tax=Volvox carteri f. nagariensis TaxID=3068 RepID=D8UB07_VOLCA|nr:uncharacterized protein VOLCADRAFT_96774 [Volvox carteri f. nagariensis]EFJ43085.1 hypothetical protein VOLCADRAFT_96774 [Volvox carteri f. nagariensis]|eukprot:XP_002955884.1 hypothetical protein VOLCADRAFT_96774 [Volvox carteri f. nagariensis]
MVKDSDVSHLGESYQEAGGPASGLLALSCGMLLACACAMPVVPDLKVTLVALGMFIWAVFQTACTPLPTIIFMCVLCVTAVFGAEQPPAAAATARVHTDSMKEGAAGGVAGHKEAGAKAASVPAGQRTAGTTPGHLEKRHGKKRK